MIVIDRNTYGGCYWAKILLLLQTFTCPWPNRFKIGMICEAFIFSASEQESKDAVETLACKYRKGVMLLHQFFMCYKVYLLLTSYPIYTVLPLFSPPTPPLVAMLFLLHFLPFFLLFVTLTLLPTTPSTFITPNRPTLPYWFYTRQWDVILFK